MNIEVRIWSHVINRWVTDLSLENLGDTKAELNDLFEKRQHITYQLYTGLKDKNGKKIYEGDIVKTCALPMHHWEVKFGKHSCSMETGQCFNAYGFYFSGVGEYCRGYHNTLVGLKVEVIGNIFENPDLLV